MRKINFNLYPNGKTKCVTFSYDDGRIYDERLTEIFDKYGAKCTFNLNAKNLDRDGFISNEFIRKLSEKHEVACHGYTHPFLERMPVGVTLKEVYEDKQALESIVKRPIIGMAYPFGTYDGDVIGALKSVDIKYCRTVKATNGFGYPDEWRAWHPTCHHNTALSFVDAFKARRTWHALPLFYVWGHSYEFNDNNNWEVMEELLEKLSEDQTIWYATNGEVYDYMTALKNLRVTCDETSVYNPSAISVFATVDGKIVEFESGLTILE